MRKHAAGAEFFESDAAQEPAAEVRDAFPAELLVIDVQAGCPVADQYAVLLPTLEEPGSPLVTGRLGDVAGFVAIENQADDVAGVLLVEPVLLCGVDHVVGGSHDIRQ